MSKMKPMWAIALIPVLLSLQGCNNDSKMTHDGQSGISARRMDPISASEQKIEMMSAQLDAITVKNEHGTLGGKNPGVLQHPGFMLDVEFIYWKAQEEGLQFAMYQDGPVANTADYNYRDIHYKFEPGLRLNIGYNFGSFDQWELNAVWTYMQTKAHGSVSGGGLSGTNVNIYPLWNTEFVGGLAASASAHWTLMMNVFDLELARNFFVSRKLSVRPCVGPRVALLHQHYKVNYNSFIGSSPALQRFRAHNEFDGGGLRAGLDLQWHFDENWNILSKLSGSLLYGHFDVSEKTNGTAAGGAYSTTFDHDFNRVRANWDIFFGLQWEKFLFNHKHHVAITFGYELAEWLGQNELANINAGNSIQQQSGDLGTQGINLKFQYNF